MEERKEETTGEERRGGERRGEERKDEGQKRTKEKDREILEKSYTGREVEHKAKARSGQEKHKEVKQRKDKQMRDEDSHHSAPAEKQSKKRKRTSEVHASNSSAELTCDPAPQHSDLHDAVPHLVQGPQLSIPPSELPQVSTVVPSFQPSTAPPLDDGPLMIHHLSAEEYQQLYHIVVDDML
ncbi:uncharacterized protein LOC117812951 isoform X4 [Xyrichtys novacula]|uniref:Uncharacterized protein LOC117812951 isoform X4 n=1 Tax=Xyrichtys novacula TaxID=13765 RepID=A0AAV1G068_XYRNO|nr:uncharacterized protein LOC117812951 isoform X4 [Xyrichtys novacula]